MSQCNSNNRNSNNSNNGEFHSGVHVPNNVFDDCPALMSDGRFITSYLPNCEMNNRVSKLFSDKPLTSWEYTYYLNNQGDKAQNYFNSQYTQKYGCSGYPYKIVEPELKQDCNTDNCVIKTVNKDGMALY